MIQKGLVSIIMAAYNLEKYIASAIASVQAQLYTDWELIVVNDGSKDNTGLILDDLAKLDNRIKVIHQVNQGVSAARNAALAQMQGEFFIIFDGDDYLPENSIAERVAYMQAHKEVYFVDGIMVKKDGNMQTTLGHAQTSFYGNPHEALMHLDSKAFVGISWMVRREEGKTYQLRKGLTHAEDLIFYIDISSNPEHILVSLPIEVLYYRVHNSSAMANLDGLKKGYMTLFGILKKEYKINLSLKLYLKYRISRIMFLSFLRKKEYKKAFSSFVQISTM